MYVNNKDKDLIKDLNKNLSKKRSYFDINTNNSVFKWLKACKK